MSRERLSGRKLTRILFATTLLTNGLVVRLMARDDATEEVHNADRSRAKADEAAVGAWGIGCG
jgi:hypothetical protein